MRSKIWTVVWAVLFVALTVQVLSTWAGELENLGDIKDDLTEQAKQSEDARQKRLFENAAGAIGAAEQAVEDGNEEDAIKNKKKALKWVCWAIKECADGGSAPNDIGESIVAEGGMSESGLKKINDLIDLLKKAKKAKEKSDFPIEQEMAIKELMNAIMQAIDLGGLEGKTDKVLKWYMHAATACDDVQEMINDLLDYINSKGSIGEAARDEAKKMVDDLYKMKKAGASSEEIRDQADKIRKFIDDEYTRVARAWLYGESEEEEEEEEKEEEKDQQQAAAPEQQVTTVRFTALDGQTTVNKEFLGDIQTIRFVAIDGEEEIPPQDVDPDLLAHDDSYTIDIGDAVRIGSIVLYGTDGIVRLLQDGKSGPSPTAGGLTAKDEMLDVGNGSLNETINVPDGSIATGLAPQDNKVTIQGEATQVVAARSGQIAVVAHGLEPPTTGARLVQLVSPGGTVLSNICPAWGYNISVPPTTKTNVAVPITAVLSGLDPTDRVTFKFLPGPGQEISPEQVTVLAAEAVGPIAQLTATEPGPQALQVIVQLEGN